MRKSDSMADLTPELNFDEVLSQFNTVLTANKILQKAQESGKSLSELSVVKESGKIKCVTNQEKNRSNSIKRKQLLERLKNRTLRLECELAKDVSNRIRRCQYLIKALTVLTHISDQELVTMRRQLESIHNRAVSLIKELRILESAIQRKKQEDPVIREVDEANDALIKAIKVKDTTKIRELKEFCKSKMEDYNMRNKRIIPYLAKARESRLKFLLEKRRLIRIQFEFYSQYMDKAGMELSEGRFKTIDPPKSKLIAEKINLLRQMRSEARESIDSLSQSLGKVALSFLKDVEQDVNTIDQMHITKMDQAIEELVTFTQELQLEVSQSGEQSKQPSSSRMVFQERQ